MAEFSYRLEAGTPNAVYGQAKDIQGETLSEAATTAAMILTLSATY